MNLFTQSFLNFIFFEKKQHVFLFVVGRPPKSNAHRKPFEIFQESASFGK